MESHTESEIHSEDAIIQNDDRHVYDSRASQGSIEGSSLLDMAGGDNTEDHEERKLAYASSSVIRFYPEWCQCMECCKRPTSEENMNSTCFEITRSLCICPPAGPLARIFTLLLEFILGWIFLWMLLNNVYGMSNLPSPAHPKGPIFALGVLEILGLCLGVLFKCFRLPSLLGPLLLGILLRNVNALNLFRNFEGWNNRYCAYPLEDSHGGTCSIESASQYSRNWIQPVRLISLAIILTRAGLELSPKQLRKLKGMVPALAFIPCCVEASTCAGVTYVFFQDAKMSVFMCFVAGFALSAVSPAVVVPGMLSLKRRRLGEAEGIPTLLIASSSIDDVLAISLYTIFLGLALPHSEKDREWENYAGGIIGIVTGIIHGIVMGMFLHFIPARDLKHLAAFRLILLIVMNITTILFYEKYELFAGAGSIGVLVTSFIASFGWRSESHWKTPMREIEHHLAHIWMLIVPLLFGTIGREIDFSQEGFTLKRVGKVISVIMICLVVRCTTVFLITSFTKFNWKERLFCSIAWIPKATVQAALAPLVMTKIIAKINEDPKYDIYLEDGQIVVLTAVLAILITAPLGAVLISFLGPILLRSPADDFKSVFDEEFPDGEDIPKEVSLNPPVRREKEGSIKMDFSSAHKDVVQDMVAIIEPSSSGATDNNPPPIEEKLDNKQKETIK